MNGIKISKCGARLNPKKITELVYKDEKFNLIEMQAKQEKPEKKTIQKRTYRKSEEKTDEDFSANIEDENLDGVTV